MILVLIARMHKHANREFIVCTAEFATWEMQRGFIEVIPATPGARADPGEPA